MKVFVTLGALLLHLSVEISAQRVAPGVNPQHYQQVPQHHQGQPHHQQQQYQQQQFNQPPPPQHQQQQQQPPQHQQQPPQHHQQQQQQYQQPNVPVQQQQPPSQHHAQHVPQPQVPQQQVHHGHPPHQQQVLGGNVQQEAQHIAEHMEVPIDTSKMTEQELQFHYFKMHDADNNNKLDGCELIKSLIHWHEEGSKDKQHHAENPNVPHVEEKVFSDGELVSLIDPIMEMDDISRDGFIDYPEFIRAQQKAAANNAQTPPPNGQQPIQHQQPHP